jgi:hypothetical protein
MNADQPTITVKLISPWLKEEIVYGGVKFDTEVSFDNADGALWEYSIDERIFEYNGVKGWYASEPSWHSMYRKKLYRRAMKSLRSDEFYHFAHNDPRYRVPHITHYNEIERFEVPLDQRYGCVAVVSNTGGRFWLFRPGFRLRNKFITNNRVHLFGRQQAWADFCAFAPLWKSGFPMNYKGELSWDKWGGESQVNFLSRFKAAICLENTIEPFYFSEKFINAARAGCVPIYHAHPTVRSGILEGALYVDPEHYNFDPDASIDAALAMDLSHVQTINRLWLRREIVRKTGWEGVWSKLAGIFRSRIDLSEPRQPSRQKLSSV